MHFLAIVFFIIAFLQSLIGFTQDPFVPKYDAVKRSERCFTVTWETYNQFGAVWWADKVDFSQDTAFNFVVYMGDRDGNGADGLAFVMHQDPRDITVDPGQQVIIGGAGTWDLEAATGDDGGGLGFAMHESRVGPNTIPGPHGPGDSPENHKIQKSVAIEMDTWNNEDVPDGRRGTDANGIAQPLSPFYGWDHTSVVYNGDIYGQQQIIEDAQGNTGRILPLKPAYAYGTANNPDGSVYHNIEDDRCYMFQVRWITNADGTQTLQLWADVYNGTTNLDGLQMVMTHTDDMLGKVFDGNSIMRFGFTGSTGGSINEQTICLLGENLKPFAQDDYASIPLNTNTIIDVEANDNDPDGDQLHVPIIIEPAQNGHAVIFDSLNANYLRYTPNTGFVGVDTLRYVTCDVNSTKCYAKCDTAFVFINVGCIPFDVDLTAISPNLVCTDSVPANGIASANVDATFIRGTVWYEGFEDSQAQQTEDTGPTGWTTYKSGSNCSPGNNLYAQNFVFRTKVVTGTDCELVFETEAIDISTVSDVCISIDFWTSNATYEADDYIETYYILDGGPETMFNINGRLDGTFGTKKVSTCGLNGTSLKIVVRVKSNHSSEEYFWDNIHVTAIGAGVPDVTYNWYRGDTPSGSIIYTGAVNNNLNSGTYTVVAIDNLTGCPSNPATITIDSAGINVPGGFIEQLSPFTNCELPYDGALGAGVIDGNDTLTVGYSFEWYFQEDPKLPSFIQRTGAIAQNLESREYTVVITEIATGCDTTINAEVPNAVSIPTVTATKISDIVSCTDPNSGVGAADVNGITTGYRFEWYAGPSIGGGPADFTGSTISTFPAGTYTVQAIDSATFCPSDPASITIEDLTELPNLLVFVDADNTSCDPAAPNGQLTGAVDESGTPTTSGYTFNWYKGPNDIIPARPGYTGGPTADMLEAGPYRLVVIQDITNCTSYVDTLIQDLTVTPPDISLAATDVNSCVTPNGTITVTLDPALNPADFEYEVYRGNGIIPDSLFVTSSANIIANLPVGNYTVIAVDINTSCASNPATTTIQDATVNPTATFNVQPQVACEPSLFTGSITASVNSGLVSDYSYEWFSDVVDGTVVPPSGANGEAISGQDSGEYVLRITSDISGCSNIYYPVVHLDQIFPVEAVRAKASTFCAPNGNGELIGSILNGTHANYSYIWRDNLGNLLTDTTATVTRREPGDYSLQIRDENTGCLSNIAPVIVYDSTVTPIPTLVATNNSSCDVTNPNGQIEVTTTNEDPTYTLSNYDYTWFDNGGTEITTTGGSFGEIVNSISEGTYELRILNTITSCDNSVLAQIIDINIKPVITAAIVTTPATRCADPFMSTAEVTEINGSTDLSGYTFTWINALNDTLLANSANPKIEDISDADGFEMPAGNYKVIAYNAFGCESDPIPFVIGDATTDPVFTLSAFNNISCDPAIQVGSLIASRPDNSYTISQYEWLDQFGNTIAPITTTDSTLLNRAAGTYSVRITDAATACTSREFATIQNSPANNPILSNTYVNGLTSCVDPNGEFDLVVNPIEQIPPINTVYRSYTFYSVNNSSIVVADTVNALSTKLTPTNPSDNSVGIDKNTDPAFSTIDAGFWTSIVVDNFTKCISDPITINIGQAPDIVIQVLDSILPADCDGGSTGSFKFGASSSLNDAPSGDGFDFVWKYFGQDFTAVASDPGSPVPSGTDGYFTEERDGLLAGYYVVSVTDRFTGCETADTTYLPIVTSPPAIIINITDATECKPGNGEIEFRVEEGKDSFGGPSGIPANSYDIILFSGPTINGNELDRTVLGGYGNPYTYGPPLNLPSGVYTIATQQNIGYLCYSEPVTVEIGLNIPDPIIVTAVTPDFTCNLNGTGTLDITANGTQDPSEYIFDWYLGTDTLVVAGLGGPNLAGLLANNYTVKIEDVSGAGTIGNGCRYKTTISLPKVLNNVNLIPVSTASNQCDPVNGSIVISDIEETDYNGITTSVGVPASYINFELFDANQNPAVFVSGNGTTLPWSGMAPDIYYTRAQHATTDCFTNFAQIIIEDDTENPAISIILNSPDYACDPSLANGELEAFSTGNSQNTAEYSFNWYQGGVGGPNVSNIGNPFIASNLTANSSSQLYTIEVVDIDDVNLGCRSNRTYTITHQPTIVAILSNNIVIEPQTICGPNGEIQITGIRETINSAFTDYNAPFTNPPSPIEFDAELLNGSLASLSGTYTFNQTTGSFEEIISGDINTIGAGTYYVRALNATNGCSYGPITQVIIRDLSRKPVISAILDSPDFACFLPDPGNTNHTGQLIAVAAGGSDGDNVTTNFNFTWTQSSSGTPVPTGGFSYIATDLWPDTYVLTVTDTDSLDRFCVSTREYIVPSARRNIQLFASGGDQTICNPDGQVQIDSIMVNGVKVLTPENTGWTSFLMDASRTDLNAPETGFISINDPFENISAGRFYVQAQDNSTLCYSNVAPVVIHDASTNPVIAMSVDHPQWSLNPNPLTWTGALSAQVTEVSGTPGTYNYEWYNGIGTTTSLNQQTDAIDMRDKGLYTFTAENTATGCMSRYYVYLPYEYLEPKFLTALTPKTVCAPNNGAIEVTDITLQGNPDDLDDYDFSFYHHNFNTGSVPDSVLAGDNSGTFYNDINTGSYYIVAKENWWWVESYPVKVDVLDSTTNPIITFDVSDYRPVTSCDQSIFTDGALGINVSEDPNNPYVQGGPYNYDYTWINETTGQVLTGINSNTVSGLTSGDYTVLVVNLMNNCEAQKTFTIDDESVTPVVVASQSPNTNCAIEIANGIATANVVNSTNAYVYQWYAGTDETANPDFNQKTWYGRPAGYYTVIAVDQSLTTCKSAPVTVEVQNATKNPVIVINEISPVTNCDPERPNGVLSAVTQDGITGHTFTWSLDGNLISTGPIASNLGLFRYDLVVINNVTLCETSMQAGPSALLGLVPPPDVDILSDRTSCLSPDGSATASLSGNVVDYIFRYYNKFSGQELSNFFQDYVIYDLDTSTYLVTAEDRTTGCVSEPTEFAIANDSYYPEIDIIALPSSCMDPTGEANVIISDMTRDFSVTWIGDNGFTAQEKELVFIPIGKYLVVVEGTDGCTTEAEAEVKGDIVIYNAVSANNDGLNEFFQILCMEYFLNNNVKIFNRAGLLVYEQDYYDPTDPARRFEGVSNRGASITGTELPIGTYFYVVDKSDGSKPKVGYLELNR